MVGLLLGAALLLVGICKSVLVVQISNPDVLLPVAEGDVFVRTYVDSMYQAPVSEKFRIEDGHFRLFHVKTESDAVLAYLGLERKGEFNVDRKFGEFSVPAASIGNHVAWVNDRAIPLGTHEDREGSVQVKLLKFPFLVHVAHCIWR
jgi:hypothetical protein